MSSLVARCELWLNSIMAWLDAPIFGHGLGSFDWAYAFHRSDHLRWMPETIMSHPRVSAGAAHNEPIHIFVELGICGAVLAGVLLWSILDGGRRDARWAVAVIASTSLIYFPLQNPATAVIAAVALGLTARQRA